jgi:hypothetical protein
MTLWFKDSVEDDYKKDKDLRRSDSGARHIRGLTAQSHACLNIIKMKINADSWNDFAHKLFDHCDEIVAIINKK